MNLLRFRIAFIAVSLLFIGSLKSQVFWDSAFANNVQTCLKAEILIARLTSLTSQSSGSTLKVALPQGFVSGGITSVKINGTAASYSSVLTGGNRIVTFTFNSALALGDVVRVELKQLATCNAGTGSYTVRDTFTFTGSSGSSTQNGNLFNGSSPSLSAASINNSPNPTTVGSTVTRTYTITNGGFGATSRFIVVDNYSLGSLSINTSNIRINPSGSNYLIPGANIIDNGDSLKFNFTPTLIQQVGDGDTLFENGESFDLKYSFTTMDCGDGSNNIQSEIYPAWLCSGTACTRTSTPTAVNITVPASPDLVFINRQVTTYCTNPGYVSIDTALIINRGGTARNLQFLISSLVWPGVPNVGGVSYTGWLDTALFKIRLGKNGPLIHPSFVMTATNTASNYNGCNWTNRPAQIRYDRQFLNNGDTLYLFIAQQYCTQQKTCGSENTHAEYAPAYPGILYDLTYFNACGNISYSAPRQIVRYHEASQIFWTNKTQDAFYCGTKGEIQFKNDYILNQLYPGSTRSTRSYYDFVVDLPPSLVADASYSTIQQVRYVYPDGTTFYPYYHPASNTWRFKGTVIQDNPFGIWVVKVVGAPSASGLCTGVYTYSVKINVLYDSTNCAPSGNLSQIVCNSTPFTYYGCNICCPEGLALLNASFLRTSFGLPDNNDNRLADGSGTVDTTLINRQIGITGDTMRLSIKTLVLTSVAHPKWENAYLGGIIPGVSSFRWQYLYGKALIKRPASTDTLINLTSYSILPNDTIRFDVSSVSNLVNGDSIIVNAFFKEKAPVDQFFSYTIAPFQYVSHMANPAPPNRFACANAIISYTHIPVNAITYNPGNFNFTGCGQAVLPAYLLNYIGNISGPGPNLFRYEFRPLLYPTRIAIKYPKGYTIDSINMIWQVGEGVNTSVNKWRYTVPYTLNNDSVIINLGALMTINGGTLPVPDEGSTGIINYYLKPSCKVTDALTQSTSSLYFVHIINTNSNFNAQASTQAQLTYNAPSFLINSSTPIFNGYGKKAQWPLTVTNAGTQTVPNVWMRIRNNSGNIPIDSIKIGGSIISQDANGFYRLSTFSGNQAKNYTIYAKNNACVFDSLQVFVGYGCNGYPTSFTDTTCSQTPRSLYLQPQPAAIQTQITALASTPNNPANPSAGTYGSSNVNMCSSFPLEFTILSTQPGTIYNVKENLYLPISGLNVGLDYVSDSGYIEYPIGSTPRKFSAAANTALLGQVSSGLLTFNLAQIAPDSFNTNKGLEGTGTAASNATRSAILRFKLRTNCNLISGAQWQAVQQAISPCGASAAGNNGVVSGFPLNINGVVPVPYVATVSLVPSLKGCQGDTATFKIIKIGSSAVAAGDSIRLFIPSQLTNSTIRCVGSACPSATPSFTINPVIGGREFAIRIPSSMGNLDSMVFKTKINTTSSSGCSASVRVGADITRQLTIFCPTTGTNCPNAKQSLGSSVQFVSVNKPQLSLGSFSGQYLQWTTYKVAGTITNAASGEPVSAGDTTQIKLFWDMNFNGTYEAGTDLIARIKNIRAAIGSGATINWTDTFADAAGIYPPSSANRLVAMIDVASGPNCNCASALSSPLIGLPVKYLNYRVTSLGCTNKIEWTTSSEENLQYFVVQTLVNNQWKNLGRIAAKGQNAIAATRYSFAHNAEPGSHYYRLVEVDNKGQQTLNNVLKATNSCNPNDKKITLLPNPAENYVSILTNNNNTVCEKYALSIVNMEGKELMTINDAQPNTSIDIKGIASGLYVVKIQCDAFTETHKLIIR